VEVGSFAKFVWYEEEINKKGRYGMRKKSIKR